MLFVEGRTEPKKCGKSKLQADSNGIYRKIPKLSPSMYKPLQI